MCLKLYFCNKKKISNFKLHVISFVYYFKYEIINILQVVLLSAETENEKSTSSYPKIKQPYSARISINENDNPYGEIYLVTPKQTKNRRLIEINELADFSFVIYIERKGSNMLFLIFFYKIMILLLFSNTVTLNFNRVGLLLFIVNQLLNTFSFY